MGAYRVEWPCCESVTITEAWKPDRCPFCYAPPMEDAAPELYAALKALADEYEPNMKAFAYNAPRKIMWAAAMAALAKARGE